MSNKLLKGTLILTGAAFLSKLIGMIYAIPFNALVGPKGVVLYYYAYNPYTILIGISTIGIPSAVSKIVSKYNSLGYYDTSLKTFRIGLFIMGISGVLAFLGLYFSADWLASKIIYNDSNITEVTQTIKVDEVKQVIRMVSFALLIIPTMAVARGFFQGNEKMEPTAISQVVEQIVRIAFVLLSAFLIIKVFEGTIATAVNYATFAAFIGAIASCVVLFLFWKRNAPHFRQELLRQNNTLTISTKELLLEILSYAGPFILVGIAIPLYQAVDTFTFNKAMIVGGFGSIAELSLAVISFNGHKLIIIPVTLATGLSKTMIPALTRSFTMKKTKMLFSEINQALQMVLIFSIPAVVGLSALAFEAYGSLYGMDKLDITGSILTWYTPLALGFALFAVTSSILQGINEQRFALISLTVGFLIKLLLNSFLIHLFSAKGSIFATFLAVSAVVGLNLWWIKRSISFSYLQTIKRSIFMVIFSLIMLAGILITKHLCGMFLPYEESRIAATIMLIIGVLVGATIYLYLAFKSTLMDHVFGNLNILNRFKRKSIR